MGDMGEVFKGMREHARSRRDALEPRRMESTKAALEKQGAKVAPGPDGFRSFRVTFPNGRRFVFWPYSGWFQGKTQGRGFAELLKAAKA